MYGRGRVGGGVVISGCVGMVGGGAILGGVGWVAVRYLWCEEVVM